MFSWETFILFSFLLLNKRFTVPFISSMMSRGPGGSSGRSAINLYLDSALPSKRSPHPQNPRPDAPQATVAGRSRLEHCDVRGDLSARPGRSCRWRCQKTAAVTSGAGQEEAAVEEETMKEGVTGAAGGGGRGPRPAAAQHPCTFPCTGAHFR